MKKILLFVATFVAVTMLSAPVAYAAPSPTEPDRILENLDDQEVPLANAQDETLETIDDPNVPLGNMDAPLETIDDPNVPLGDMDAPLETIDDPNVPLGDMDAPLEVIDDPNVPLAYIPAPQTGVNGLEGMEALALVAIAFTMSGAIILVKTRKQTCSVR